MLISLKDITKVYPDGAHGYQALKGVSFNVEEGDFLSIMGPSGCGKSTLLSILGLLDQATSGSYSLDGREVARLDDSERTHARLHKIGFVFQSFNLLPRFTSEENVALPMRYKGGQPYKEIKARAKELLTSVGLGHKVHRTPLQLSGGERQRVAIARALANTPRLILADEPTGNLDTKSSAEIVALLKELNDKGLALIVVTHDPNVAAMAKHVIRMRDGLIVEGAA